MTVEAIGIFILVGLESFKLIRPFLSHSFPKVKSLEDKSSIPAFEPFTLNVRKEIHRLVDGEWKYYVTRPEGHPDIIEAEKDPNLKVV